MSDYYSYPRSKTSVQDDELLVHRRAYEAERLRKMAAAYSNSGKHFIEELPKEVYENSLRLQPVGIIEEDPSITHPLNSGDGKRMVFPSIRGSALTAEAAKKLGTYSVSGNVVKFTDRNGETWVSPFPSVLLALRRAESFREISGDCDVPFVHGRRPTGIFKGKNYRLAWNNLMDRASEEIEVLRRAIAAAEAAEAEAEAEPDSVGSAEFAFSRAAVG